MLHHFNDICKNKIALPRSPTHAITPLSPSSRPRHAPSGITRSPLKIDCSTAKSTRRPLRVRYVRRDKNYNGWGLHIWGKGTPETAWDRPLNPTGADDQSPYWDLDLSTDASNVGLLIHKGEEKAAGGDVQCATANNEVWLVANEQGAFDAPPDWSTIPVGSLTKSYAHWVNEDTLVWRIPPADDSGPRRFSLHFSARATMRCTSQGIQGDDIITIPLQVAGKDIPPDVMARYPYLYGCTTLKLPPQHLPLIPDFITGQLALSAHDATNTPVDATGVQLQGVLDSLFYYSGPLGDHYLGEFQQHCISVWAPTAQQVQLLHWSQLEGGEAQVYPMLRNSKGAWSFARPADWTGQCYMFRVTVYCSWTQRIEVTEATDPYSRCTTADGERSLLVDMAAGALQPPGWAQHQPPPLASWNDISVYELHVRDFSMGDASVPEQYRGKYRAFCPEYVAAGGGLTHGLRHLAELRQAGLSHLHLLPVYDFATVPEKEQEQLVVQEDLSQYPPDSDRQQAAVAAVADRDGFNWGYDPVHWGVPEGSYSQEPVGSSRVLEFREMVAALHAQGWRVVLDVVYNHTYDAGPHNKYSVLDKIVPAYYHRRMEDGDVCQSTCCNNTASENLMCERLVVDDIVHWAVNYKVDGFRFDIMGHLLLSTMKKIRAALDGLTVEKDGVDGAAVYVYGEAWDFGEMVHNQRGRNASQMNLAGTKLGAFNDRMRDGAMGGSPFMAPDAQGLATGLYLQPNESEQGSAAEQLQRLLVLSDWVRFTLAGNLREYSMQVADGRTLRGVEARYFGTQPLAYGSQPVENIVYNGCHDNETIFDQVTAKAAEHVDAEGRAHMCRLALALAALAQGIPFFHAGDDLLRSKSLDRDSYNSGDWFNRIDWTGQDNGFGSGLPPASKNQHAWPFKKLLLAAADRYKPSPALIAAAAAHFKALLRVRYSSPLFRLPTVTQIQQQVFFHNTGPDQVPGLIVMELRSAPPPPAAAAAADSCLVHDPLYKRLLVVFNADASDEAREVGVPAGVGRLQLHPELAALQGGDRGLGMCGVDNVMGVVRVAPQMSAVFVERW